MQALSLNRPRLLEGLALSIEEKGYAAVTIADVARHARVSKRTFYEEFGDKQECFLALYAQVSDDVLARTVAAAQPELPWRKRIETGVEAYLRALERRPRLTRTCLLEIHAAGPRALKVRRDVLHRFAAQLRALVQAARADEPSLRPLSQPMAVALVGGINELVLVAVEEGRERLRSLARTASDLIGAALTAT